MADLTADSAMVVAEIERTHVGEESARRVLQVLDGELPESVLGTTSWFELLGPSAQPLSTSWTFQELRSTGNVRLLVDGGLRRDLFEYYSMVEFQRQRMEYTQQRGRDFTSDIMWSGGFVAEDLSVESLRSSNQSRYAIQRLISYHGVRRTFLETWHEAVGRTLASARAVAGS